MILTVALIALFIYSIPKLGLLPLAPRFILLGGGLFLLIQYKDRFIEALSHFFVPLYFYFLVVGLLGLINLQLRDILIPLEAVLSFSLIFVVLNLGMVKAVVLTRAVALIILLSVLWFFASLVLGGVFMQGRYYLYSGELSKYLIGDVELERATGLALMHVNMGYQICLGLTLSIFLYLAENRIWKKFWLVITIVMIAGLIYVAQRSTIPAVASVCVLAALLGRKWKNLILITGLLSLSCVIIFFAADFEWGKVNLQSRVENVADTHARIGWQIAALKVIASSPMGNLSGGLNWEERSVEMGADYSYYGWDIKAVHNSYLGRVINYGWGAGLLILFVSYLFYRHVAKPILSTQYSDSKYKLYAESSVYAFIALSVQALFHNASMYTLEPASWVAFSLSCAWAALLKKESLHGCNGALNARG